MKSKLTPLDYERAACALIRESASRAVPIGAVAGYLMLAADLFRKSNKLRTERDPMIVERVFLLAQLCEEAWRFAETVGFSNRSLESRVSYLNMAITVPQGTELPRPRY